MNQKKTKVKRIEELILLLEVNNYMRKILFPRFLMLQIDYNKIKQMR